MIVFKRGTKLPPKYLTAVLQERHEMLRKSQAERLARRKERGAPLSDEEPCDKCGRAPDEEPLGPFEGFDHLDGLVVVFRSISLGQTRGYRLRQLEAATKINTEEAETLVAAERESSKVKREAVAELVVNVDGLATEDGSDLAMPAGDRLTDDELDLLEDNGILDALFTAGLHLQDLTDEARKNSGASRRSTSADTTATPALPTDEQAGDVTTETAKGDSALTTSTSGGTMTATTPPAYARSEPSSETPLSAPSSSSPDSSAMQV